MKFDPKIGLWISEDWNEYPDVRWAKTSESFLEYLDCIDVKIDTVEVVQTKKILKLAQTAKIVKRG